MRAGDTCPNCGYTKPHQPVERTCKSCGALYRPGLFYEHTRTRVHVTSLITFRYMEQAVAMRDAGKKTREIADAMGTSPAHVASLLQNAKSSYWRRVLDR